MITSALPKYNVSPLHITFSHKAKNITYIDKLFGIRKAHHLSPSVKYSALSFYCGLKSPCGNCPFAARVFLISVYLRTWE